MKDACEAFKEMSSLKIVHFPQALVYGLRSGIWGPEKKNANRFGMFLSWRNLIGRAYSLLRQVALDEACQEHCKLRVSHGSTFSKARRYVYISTHICAHTCTCTTCTCIACMHMYSCTFSGHLAWSFESVLTCIWMYIYIYIYICMYKKCLITQIYRRIVYI